ncbi:MAG: S8 family peptidase [Candidatus Eisenbacteria bacterium]|nr:S8 family peptidase [Candidatus Eisenbacteria bacterium]
MSLRIALPAAGLLAALALQPLPVWADYEAEQVVVSLQPGYTIEEVNERWGTITLDAFPEGNLYLLGTTGLGGEEELAELIAADPAVLEAEANYLEETPESIRQMVIVIVGEGYVEYQDQTIAARIGLDEAHWMSRGAGATVAILDTGVDPEHEALAGRLAPAGRDFVDGDLYPWDESNGVDEDQDGFTDEGFGHGTMVAGIVALVAPEATLLPVRVLGDEGSGSAYQIAKGIRHAVNQGVDVINMSFGIPRNISILGHQISYARDHGVVVIAGAGNENLEQAYYPAGDGDAAMITAVDSLDLKAAFADWHHDVLVSAPGTGVRSAWPGGQWAQGDGCSFATPFVSGEAALIRSLAPGEPPRAVLERITDAIVPVDELPGNAPYEEKLGTGRIYLPEALSGIASAPANAPVPASVRAAPNPSAGVVRLYAPVPLRAYEARVFDAAGRLVRRLAPAEVPEWHGDDGDARPVPPGVYFVRFAGPGRAITASVTIVR